MITKRNIFLIGPMGAGKSTIGRLLTQELNMEFYDSDQELENRTGVDISWIFDIEGELGFRIREEKIIDELTRMSSIVLATGGGSIISKDIRNFLSSRGIVIYLQASVQKQLMRTKKDSYRPLLKTGDDMSVVLQRLAFQREELYKSITDLTFNTDNKNVKSIVYNIIKMLKTI
ncbi:shikimate kinase AroK [Buchnera aphidicola]|uniref:Shikimate kinase 1 n=1 Tax=Buchnera aphidicola (Stegophylla sp.) TaxID=2315800 RepID=A0A4D6Y9S9_9GAMM|nr:shikimate kinase AroK [Buchnera aphidicola (Stegophylla sp.)]QCI26497.1 shikimate kinase AroK [Buchnera aphidicola (Stegophylla sp.)]